MYLLLDYPTALFKEGEFHSSTPISSQKHHSAMSAAVNADPVNPNAQSSKPNVNLQHGLATPEPTPGPDKNRVAAEAARRDEARNAKTQEVISEIERVIKCAENDYAGLLGVALDASDDTKLAAWRRLGCMTHAKTCSHSDQTTAFESMLTH